MSDQMNNQNNRSQSGSDLELLSKKYGVSSATGNTYDNRTSHSPVRSTPARTPRIVYDVNDPTASIKIEYKVNQNMPMGPEGRRVIYSETETESIAEKRRRNAELQKTEKGSRGFGSQPYVKHVASSKEAIKRDDVNNFAREYTRKKAEPEKETASAPETQLTADKDRLVALNQEAEKKRAHMHYEKSTGEKVKGVFKSFIPWKGDSVKEVFRKIIMNTSAILVIVCFVFFIDNYLKHQNENELKEQLKSDIPEIVTTDDAAALEAQWAAIKAKYPDVVFPEGMNIKWAELYGKNQDFAGWLKIDNTNIDTPVMHTPSDRDQSGEDYYLRKNFYKKYDKYGTPYLEKYNTGSSLDKNNTIYGHNMMDGLSFAQLEKYYTIDGFKESPVIQYSTLYKDYYFKVYAVIITNGYPSGDNGYLFNYNISHFGSNKNFETFITALDERKLYDTGVDINKDDKLITLSTCSYEIKQSEMGRLAVIGRLVRDGESTTVDTSKAVANDNVRYPQIWYSEHNISNPFYNAYQWVPQ